jgi:phage shock protein A
MDAPAWARTWEEFSARVEGVARAAKEDVAGVIKKVAALHSKIDDLTRRLELLEKIYRENR